MYICYFPENVVGYQCSTLSLHCRDIIQTCEKFRQQRSQKVKILAKINLSLIRQLSVLLFDRFSPFHSSSYCITIFFIFYQRSQSFELLLLTKQITFLISITFSVIFEYIKQRGGKWSWKSHTEKCSINVTDLKIVVWAFLFLSKFKLVLTAVLIVI